MGSEPISMSATAPDDAPLPPGTIIGNYRLDRFIRSGSDDCAYRAHDAASARRVIVKELKPAGFAKRLSDGRSIGLHCQADRARWERAIEEVRGLAASWRELNHPGVVALLDCIEDNDTVYAVFEQTDGKPLASLLEDGESLIPEELDEILHQVLSTVSDLHETGLLHLDLSPRSVVLRREGIVRLGRTHLLNAALVSSDGPTPADPLAPYRAEELAAGGPLGRYTDIFALGATFFRLLSGHAPESASARKAAIAAGEPDPVHLTLAELDGVWRAPLLSAVRLALAVSAGNRPQDIRALRKALGAATVADIPTKPLRKRTQPGPVSARLEDDEAPTARAAGGERGSASDLRVRPGEEPVSASNDEPVTVWTSRATYQVPRVAPAEPAYVPRKIESPTAPLVHTIEPSRPVRTSGEVFPDDIPTVRLPPRAMPPVLPEQPPPVPPATDKIETVIYRRGKAEKVAAPRKEEAPSAPDMPAIPARFTVYQPMTVPPGRWLDLFVYMHEPGIDSLVRQDYQARLEGRQPLLSEPRMKARFALRPGAPITVVPQLPGCRFNPPRATLEWWENFHRYEFRVMAGREVLGFATGSMTGTVSFYAGPLLVGETRIVFTIAEESIDPITNTISAATDSFGAVFPAFAVQDGEIADRLSAVAEQLDSEYLAGVLALRAAKWDREILKKIELADRFQLFWSQAASRSPHLEEEWKFAMALGRDNFVSATYWRHPAPGLPPGLGEPALRFLPLPIE
jgi:serine/threonine protein kinase